MASLLHKEEPLLKQLVRTRALNTRENSASPTRRSTSHLGASARSMSQPPPRMPRQPAPPTVYTLQLLPYSVVYPPPKATPKVSFCSVSQPDLTKLITTSPSVSRCSTPSMTISGCGSPSRAATPTSWFYTGSSHNSFDANNNDMAENSVFVLPQNNVCKCPVVRKDACFSSLCCEICKLFPNENMAAKVANQEQIFIQPKVKKNLNDNEAYQKPDLTYQQR